MGDESFDRLWTGRKGVRKFETFTGQWCDGKSPEELRLEEAARTGDPFPITIDLEGGPAYEAVVRVSKTAEGEFSMAPLEPLRKTRE